MHPADKRLRLPITTARRSVALHPQPARCNPAFRGCCVYADFGFYADDTKRRDRVLATKSHRPAIDMLLKTSNPRRIRSMATVSSPHAPDTVVMARPFPLGTSFSCFGVDVVFRNFARGRGLPSDQYLRRSCPNSACGLSPNPRSPDIRHTSRYSTTGVYIGCA